MQKYADKFLIVDPWKIVENSLDSDHRLVAESVFSLANEYIGIRGYFEEGTVLQTLRGSYYNGVFDVERSTNQSAYKGIVNETHFMVNAPDWLYTTVIIDNEQLQMGHSDISSYSRVLDMKNGTLTRSFIWRTRTGKEIEMIFERFLDMTDVEKAYQRISCTPLNFSGQLYICIGLNGNIIQESRKKKYWKEESFQFFTDGAAMAWSTIGTGQSVASAYLWKTSNVKDVHNIHETGIVAQELILTLTQGVEAIVDKFVINRVYKNGWNEEKNKENLLAYLQKEIIDLDYKKALNAQEEYWSRVWNTTDIEIDGDDINQQGIRFCIFQMQQTYHGQDPEHNIGAKGLTGEAYNGHAFWDTETYCLSFYLFNNLNAAKNLLLYRYNTLPQAKARAKMLDCHGACYPVATLNGNEACDLWQHASLQFQPSTAVAYGIYHYHRLSGDDDFLFQYGAEILVEVSRFLISRGAWNADRSGFGFYGVMGPDEFHMMVNHNTYTNFMAKKTFEFTLQTLERMSREASQLYQHLKESINFTEQELDEFRICADRMIILYNEKTKLFEQHEGFFNLPHTDIRSIPVTDFPLYHHWSYDRIYRTDMIKQPDVLMFLLLHNSEFDPDIIRANYNYYEPKTIHESSLSPSVHSILAVELGEYDQAYQFFNFATRMDLDNYNRNTGEGLHTTSIAAAWMNIVYGFGGLRSDGSMLKLAPILPAKWHSYSFSITYKGYQLKILVMRDSLKIKAEQGEGTQLQIVLYGKPVSLVPGVNNFEIPQKIRG
ncbi:glycoside hydrolase family 65 protein [Gracilinema caldarium]|uniref:glycoside hydrolase family 65 protein n=1 Tax=Gracilinema caldarium TaxID=215591 RepID=UPI0026F2935E|nr:glycosyl hydrolase family 65 protein [Gracilinema caldarium]